jgi:hypothetical protein
MAMGRADRLAKVDRQTMLDGAISARLPRLAKIELAVINQLRGRDAGHRLVSAT